MQTPNSSPCQSVSVLQASRGPVRSLIVKAVCTSTGAGQDQTAAAVTHQWNLSSHGPKRNAVSTLSVRVFICEPGGCRMSPDLWRGLSPDYYISPLIPSNHCKTKFIHHTEFYYPPKSQIQTMPASGYSRVWLEYKRA